MEGRQGGRVMASRHKKITKWVKESFERGDFEEEVND